MFYKSKIFMKLFKCIFFMNKIFADSDYELLLVLIGGSPSKIRFYGCKLYPTHWVALLLKKIKKFLIDIVPNRKKVFLENPKKHQPSSEIQIFFFKCCSFISHL